MTFMGHTAFQLLLAFYLQSPAFKYGYVCSQRVQSSRKAFKQLVQ